MARFEIEIVKDGKTAAEKTAKEADHVKAVIGCNPVINSKEEVDRTTIVLPTEQEELVKRVAAVNPNTIVALISNYLKSCRRIIHADGKMTIFIHNYLLLIPAFQC